MAIEKHVIELTARDRVSPAFQKIGTEAEKAGNKAETAGAKGSKSLKAWGDAANKVGVAVGALALISSRAAGESEASAARLESSFSNAGLAVDDFQDKINRLNSEGLGLAFDDEDVQDSLAALVDATGDAEKAFRDVAIAEDIARARKISLAAATKIVIAAEQERFGQLQRLGIQIDDTATSEEALAALQQKYAGQAEAYADTSAASYDRLANSVENALESIGGVANQALVPILALSTAAPALTAVGGALSGLVGGSAGLVAMGSALAGIGVAAGALAAPVGIATYLFLDQKNVVEKATRATLENKQALEGYIDYLNGINVTGPTYEEAKQEFTDFLNFMSNEYANTAEVLFDPGAPGVSGGNPFVTQLKDWKDEFLRLAPEIQGEIVNTASLAGIDVFDPSTWSDSNVQYLIELIASYSSEANQAAQDTLELNRALNRMTSEQEQAALATDFHKQSVAAQTTAMAISEDQWLQSLSATKDTAAAQREASGAFEKTEADVSALNAQLSTLAVSLADATPADTLDRVFGAIVGNTNAMVGSIQTAADWATELGLTTTITEDLTRAQEASAAIQTAQLPLIEQQTDATADWLENLAGLSAEEQQLALAYADSDYAGRITEITDLAASYDTMTDAQKANFDSLLTGAAEADPVLASVLENLGLITTTDGEIKINYDAVGGADDSTLALIDSVDNLTEVLKEIFDIQIDDTDAVEASGLLGAIATQMANLDGSTATVYVNRQQIGFTDEFALGGVMGWGGDAAALGMSGRGNVALVGETGPELVYLPGGSRVEPNSSSRYKMGGGDGIVINGPITVIANDTQSFIRELRQSSVVLERR